MDGRVLLDMPSRIATCLDPAGRRAASCSTAHTEFQPDPNEASCAGKRNQKTSLWKSLLHNKRLLQKGSIGLNADIYTGQADIRKSEVSPDHSVISGGCQAKLTICRPRQRYHCLLLWTVQRAHVTSHLYRLQQHDFRMQAHHLEHKYLSRPWLIGEGPGCGIKEKGKGGKVSESIHSSSALHFTLHAAAFCWGQNSQVFWARILEKGTF